jgi:hypothetical protein
MSARAKRIYGLGGAKKVFPLAVAMWAMFGVLFGGFGVQLSLKRGEIEWFILLFAAISLVLAIATYRRTKALELNC